MRRWWQLAIRNWRARPGRTLLATIAIALGVGEVVWVTGAYESIRKSIADRVWTWVGRSHLNIESVYGHNGTVFESLVSEVRTLPNVAASTGRLVERVEAVVGRDSDDPSSEIAVGLQVFGIQPETEYRFRDYAEALDEGTPLEPGARGVALVERGFADEYGIRRGAALRIRRDPFSPVHEFRVVGLLSRQRMARFQQPLAVVSLPELQQIANRPGPPRVTQVDIVLHDTSPAALGRTYAEVRRLVDRHQQGFRVTSAEAKLRQVETAQAQTRLILVLISGVAMFTAFFIILSTLSMGMVERIGQLGLLRCVGMTRGQLAILMLGEVIPVGLVGISLGVPAGIGLIALSVLVAPGYIGSVEISVWGVGLALAGGAATAIGGGVLPALQAMRVSPLEASRPQSHAVHPRVDVLAAVLGAAMIAGHIAMIEKMPAIAWFRPPISLSGVMLLYCGFALLAPALVRFGGGLFVRAAAAVLRIRSRLLSDQVGRAAWRSAGICSGLMVGLSLIVCLVVHTESVNAAWDFPKRMCEAFIWTRLPVRLETAREAARIPGVGVHTLVNDIRCSVGRFAAGEPETFFQMAQLAFSEGNREDAVAKLRKGGYILVTPEFADRYNLKLDSPVRITANDRTHTFRIAGIVESPAIEIAAAYFNADSDLTAAQMNGVMGTLEDARRVFHVGDDVTLFLLNFDLPATPPPRLFCETQLPRRTRPHQLVQWMEDWHGRMPERRDELETIRKAWSELGERAERLTWASLPPDLFHLQTFRDALTKQEDVWHRRTPEERWRAFREEVVMAIVAQRSGASNTMRMSVVELKAQIDATLRTATYLLTAIPMVAMVVAALGVGNLMMANVTSRTRQLAILRAVGATRSQIARLVIGEALVLGAIGSVLGVFLGRRAAHGVNALTERIWMLPLKFHMPWSIVLAAIALTIGVCLVAGFLPARRAARSNVVEALHVA